MFRKTLGCILLCVITTGFVFATDSAQIDASLLDRAQVETYIDSKAPVSWREYNSEKQIRDMGRRLGSEIKYQDEVMKAVSPYASGYPSLKYKVVRIFPGDKAGADVLYVAKNAGVNTIKNMNRIVSGYIEKAYDIPVDKADSIAVKICYWNTNHYDDQAYFRDNFQSRVREVFANRTKLIGLARSYKNWPGKTRLVIPFVLIKEEVPEAVEPVAPEAAETPEVASQEVIPQSTVSAPVEKPVAEKVGLPVISIILLILLIVAIFIIVLFVVKHFLDKKDDSIDSIDN